MTEDDVQVCKEWIQIRRTRTNNLLSVVECTDPRYQALVEDSEICDILMDILDMSLASDFVVTSLGVEDDG